MRLHWSPRSPFVRKVTVAAHELGLSGEIECVRSVAAMNTANPAIMADNPLGKIPALVLDDGRVLTDSDVIVEYLDSRAGHRLLPREGEARWDALSRQALASGLLDLLVLWRNVRGEPPERQSPAWLAAFAAKAEATLDRFAPPASLDVGAIALGCALSYADFRFPALRWRDGRPALAEWHERFDARPSMRATASADD